MRVHHLILGVHDLAQTEVFYREVLGLRLVDAFLDSGTGREGLVMTHRDERGEDGLALLFVPFSAERLPSPQHLALEVSETRFNAILSAAAKYQLLVRRYPDLENKDSGTIRVESQGQQFEHFYLLDPSGVNLEILKRVLAN